jgi:glycopeptide antibiotics resistance protein
MIILLSILAILVEFTTYYFFEAFYVVWGVSCLISIICCHILLEQSTSYEACFNFSLLTLFVSLVIIVLTYFGNVSSFLPYTGVMFGVAVINWLIPLLHCFLRYMLDYGTRIDGFNDFYRNTSIIFFTFYLGVILYGSFVPNAFSWTYTVNTDTYNFLPFGVIASQIEEYLYDSVSLNEIVTYLLSRIVIFVPYGFYIALLLRRQTRLPRFFALFLLPFLLEVLQYIFLPELCDIDDLIYAVIGGLIGTLMFFLMNMIFRAVSGKDFLSRDTDYRFVNSPLHF